MSQGKVAEAPDEFDADLHGESRAGQHAGAETPPVRPAHDLKDLHEKLAEFSSEEMKSIPVLAPGVRLEQGAVYCDLNNLQQGSFRAMGAMETGPDDYYVAKNMVDYELWNKLTKGDEGRDNSG